MEIDELKKKAEQGDADAQYEVGMHYLRARNLNVASFWLEQAAEQGNRASFFRLNTTVFQGNPIKDEIEKWYSSLANQGNLDAQYYFGSFLNHSGRHSEALKWILRAANQQYLPAQLRMARIYEKGNDGIAVNYEKALEWYRVASEQGSLEANRAIGRFYMRGKGVKKSRAEAFKWYQKDVPEQPAQTFEQSEAQWCLATEFYFDRKYREALKWYKITATGSVNGFGSPAPYEAIGGLYEEGKGVKRDYIEALKWYKKAAENDWVGSKLFFGKKLFEYKLYSDALEWFEKIISDKEASDDTKKEAQDYIEKCQKLINPSNSIPFTVEDECVKSFVEKELISNTLEALLQQLQSLIGLNEVKQEVSTLVNLLKLQSMRKQHGLPEIPMSRHLVFVRNPGTGKTTVARILAEIHHQLGILSQGQLIEVDRSGLVAGYVGQTALKTQDAIQSALGGILFIDEAYALAKPDSSNDFGQEAIDTILKAMEDHRDDFIVIVAGYPDLMKTFINSNPGLKSRFSKYIYFPDYTPEERLDIFKLQCKNAGLTLENGASEIAFDYLRSSYEHRDSNFANGRSVRNYFEKVLSNQANRLAMQSTISETDLITLSKDDVQKATVNTTL